MKPFVRPIGILRPYASFSRRSLLSHIPPQHRAFHASHRSQYLQTAIIGTHDLLTTIHNTAAIPWYLLIPLTALTFRLLITLPLSLVSRRAIQNQVSLTPILTAWSHQIQRKTMREKGALGPGVVEKDAAQAFRIKRRELYRRWRCGSWRSYLPVLGLPVWLLGMETVRAMVGAKKGLLGMMMGGAGSEEKFEDVVSSGQDLQLQETVQDLVEAGITTEAVANIPIEAVNPLFEPTLTTEGMLWFTDLTAPDPLLILPFILSGTLLLNLLPSRRKSLSVATQSVFSRRLTNVLRVFALAAGPLTLQMPAAMLFYWISSSFLALIQNLFLDRWIPIKPSIQPTKPKKGIIEKTKEKPTVR